MVLDIGDNEVVRGATYIPKMNSYLIMDIAKTYSDNINITGFRCPEKIYEQLWTEYENQYVRDQVDCYCLYPSFPFWPIPAVWGLESPRVETSLNNIKPWTPTK
jgi:FlaA1/EpsC-like NDP-sugar epimerase